MAEYVFIMAPAVILASVFTALWGKIYDKRGFRFSALISVLLLMAGYILLFAFKTKLPVFIGSLLMMSGYLSGMADFGAVIRDHTPVGMAGRFQGLRIVFQVLLPGFIGPWIGAWVLRNAEYITNSDGTASFLPNANIFLAALIAAIALTPLFVYLYRNKISKKENA